MKRPVAMLMFFCVGVVSGFALGGQDFQPISDRSRRIEIPGLSVNPPQGEDWFLFPVSPQEASPADAMIRFVRRLQEAPPARPEDARAVHAAVIVMDSGEMSPPTPSEFLQAFTEGEPKRVGQMITRRQRLIEFPAALDNSLGATCIRYSRVTEITGQFPLFPDLVAISSTRGLFCSHPHWPQYNIDLTYDQMYPKGEKPLSLDAEADMFLESVVFTPARPVAVVGPKELFSSHMQAGLRTYEEQRWSEAEVSFQAALNAAESFGPQNLPLAAALYYLASTKDKLGQPADAEPLLRRALDIFDTQTGVDDPEVARLHGGTLNDLGVIHAVRASRATSPSSKQGQLEEAEHLLQRALAIREKSHPSQVGRTLSNLAQLYMDWGRWGDAAMACERAVSFYEQERGPDDQEVIYQLERLVLVYLWQGRLAEAEPVMERVVSGMEKKAGP